MPEIVHELTINAPVRKVYQALTQRDGLENWWTRDADAQPVEGSVATFGFGNPGNLTRMRIERLEEPRLVKWRCIGGPAEWVNTDVIFRLTEEPDGTVVRFQHLKWKSLDGFLPHCSYKWAFFLRSLKFYLERDAGMPYPHDIE